MSTLGSSGLQHYVSPKEPGGFVVLKAVGPDSSNFSTNYAWEGDGQAVSGSPEKRQVARDAPGKYQVRLRNLNSNTIVDTMNVWIVWTNVTVLENPKIFLTGNLQTGDNTIGPAFSLRWGYRFTFAIDPASIITDTDRPELAGENLTSPPGADQPHVITGDLLQGGATSKWDCSRQVRTKILNPSLYPPDLLAKVGGFLWNGQPATTAIPVDYPIDPVLGNDDASTADETNDPYPSFAQDLSNDDPLVAMRSSTGADGDTFENRTHFIEFLRLNLGSAWFRISDDYPWRIHYRFVRSGGSWIDDNSIQEQNNDGF